MPRLALPLVLLLAALLAPLPCPAADAVAADSSAANSVDRPNIIFIMVDDMGRDWVSCYGAAHATPHVDALARDGVRFDNVWCNPICTPTRMTLLTGQYPFRNGWTSHHDVPRWGGIGFDWNRFTSFARVLKDAGYATAIGGKWQINDFRKQPDALARHGFDEHCMWTGFETGNPPSYKRYWDGYLQTNGERASHDYAPDTINDFLIDFIRRHKDGPFLVYYPMMLVHGPFLQTPFNRDDPPKSKDALYAGNVTYMDHLVGRLVKAVDDLGIGERTVIIFTGDNGSSAIGQLDGKPYPKGKGAVADRGAHVPFVVRAPQLTAGGSVCRDLVDFSDMLPTFADLAGAPLPADVTLDGRSIVGSIRGAEESAKREWVFSQRGADRMVRDHRYLLDSKGGFYDLEADPTQKSDLADSDDPAHAKARKKLAKVLQGLPADGPLPFDGYRRKTEATPKQKRNAGKKSSKKTKPEGKGKPRKKAPA